MFAFLWKAGVINDPRHYWPLLLHCRQHLLPHLSQQSLIAPGGFGDHMMQRLAHGLDAAGIQTRRHRLDALPFARKQQSFAVILQRLLPVLVPRGLRQALHIGREAFLLWAWRGEP